MRLFRRLFAAATLALVAVAPAPADAPAKKRVLLVTHSGGFIHDALGTAEDTLKKIGPDHGMDVTCWRFTGDPAARVTVRDKGKPDRQVSALEDYSAKFRKATGKAAEPENCGRINKDTLKNFDIVLFFTTSTKDPKTTTDPVTKDELADLTAWVKAGGAFAGVHCATDTLYSQPAYGEMIGAYFGGHPAQQKIRIQVEDAAHPAGKAFADGTMLMDEIYVFTPEPYSRDKVRIILSAGEFKPGDKLARKDADYALSWCKEYGKGKVFYTSLGHRKDVWENPTYQQHLIAGLKWAAGQVPGDATPTGKK